MLVVEHVDMSLCEFSIGIDYIRIIFMIARFMKLSIRMRTCVESIGTFKVEMDMSLKRKKEEIMIMKTPYHNMGMVKE
jgi:hypothetical protein